MGRVKAETAALAVKVVKEAILDSHGVTGQQATALDILEQVVANVEFDEEQRSPDIEAEVENQTVLNALYRERTALLDRLEPIIKEQEELGRDHGDFGVDKEQVERWKNIAINERGALERMINSVERTILLLGGKV